MTRHPVARRAWTAYGITLLIVAACTLLAGVMERHFDPANLTMIYLLGVVIAAVAFGRGPAITAAVLSVAVFDFVFVPPRFTFDVADTQYLVTFAVLLVVAIVIGTLTAWLREQRQAARAQQQRTALLYRLSRDLSLRSTAKEIAAAATARIAEGTSWRVALSLAADSAGADLPEAERAAAQRACENAQPVRFESAGLAGWHLPLEAGTTVLGTLSAWTIGDDPVSHRQRFHLLRALATQTALALERCRLAGDVARAEVQAEAERTRSALLSSVSHDLRTPLASITGAASSLRDRAGVVTDDTSRELADTIAEEAGRLNRLVGNLLDMTRLESGLELRKDWQSIEEIVGVVLDRMGASLGGRQVRIELPSDLPLVPLDEILFEQAISNLIENAIKYTPEDSPIEIHASRSGGFLRFDITDHGPGFDDGDETRVFEKFYRGARAAAQPGAGLGLAICQAIVRAHGGTLEARNRPEGGAWFRILLPLGGEPPAVEAERLEVAP